MSFKTARETKIQTIQYRIIHRIIPCNEWLHNIKIRDINKCNVCPGIDTIFQLAHKIRYSVSPGAHGGTPSTIQTYLNVIMLKSVSC